MPLAALLTLGLDVLCIVHIMKTGRPYQWIFLIMMVPVAGAAAYFVVEILPDLRHSRASRQVAKDIGRVIDPDREFRELIGRVDEADTVENKFVLAKECLGRERYDDASRLLESCLVGVHEDDAAIMLALAQARFGLEDYAGARGILDRLREAHPDLRSPEGHLLYARSVEGLGDSDRALTEYEALAGYYPGEEGRCRYALLLQKLGRVEQAKAVFGDVKRSVERASKVYFRAQRDWYEVAKRNLGE
ncbi:MAG: tetratricopeptide repeat protein [Rhodospirillales bacterium]|nr:tetratricopeptide repeat protein [Rhodospirillales bacterium]